LGASWGRPQPLGQRGFRTIQVCPQDLPGPLRYVELPQTVRATILGPDIGAKWVQLLQELIPTVVRVAFLWNPNNASHAAYRQELQAAAPALNAKLLFVEVGSAGEF